MFFISGSYQDRKDLDYNQQMICDFCGRYCSFHVFMTYMVLTFFFIPIFKWDRRYYVETSCCGSIYELNPEIGKAIANGEKVEISQDDLVLIEGGYNCMNYHKKCHNCGYETDQDFGYCPKCGERFD